VKIEAKQHETDHEHMLALVLKWIRMLGLIDGEKITLIYS